MITATTPVDLRLMIFMLCVVSQVVDGEQQMRCLPKEREALLQFKAAIVNRYAMLSSWTTPDCYQWEGIRCSNLTSHIIGLHLHGDYYEFYVRGEIHKSLMELPKLQYLNLSHNYFPGSHIPEFLASLRNLRYLDLSLCDFGGEIPSQLGFLSHLKYLNLAWNSLEGLIPHQLGNLSQLRHLDLSGNSFKGNIPSQLGNLFRLQYLSLNGNSFEENIPSQLGNLSHCSILILVTILLKEIYHLNLEISPSYKSSIFLIKSFGNACSLLSLDISNNSLSDELPIIISHLSGCARYSLQELCLHMNQISGTLHDFSTFTSLKRLYLSENKLNGEIPENISFPSKLEELYIDSNSLKGVLSDYHFTNMSKLHILDLSDNSLALTFTQNWVLPFQLFIINLRSCKLGPTFPKWLQTQNKYFNIDVSKAAISDIVPKWFWAKLPLQKVTTMNISYNHLRGEIPIEIEKLSGLISLNLSRNNLIGKIPSNIGKLVSLDSLDLSRNWHVGSIPLSLAQIYGLGVLDLSHNHLSGQIPIGTQLQSFNKSSYENNIDLCGSPLENCYIDEKLAQEPNVKVYKDEYSFFNNDFLHKYGNWMYSKFLDGVWLNLIQAFLETFLFQLLE
ncbi:putative leucine-rich repeat receptor-like serine/threonine-protein kinase At2g24130 [Vigna radiata var. radiata]|uniref:Leucine-rich repeat receptor-like serine/threonine-protein kinase At2g24130 n=1 Tax=Vigna radiata var. radiata TaxID=3916 RepID=A0A1S3U6U0_VIGRR|nr:putative leucine-rich repeat receptor-like serine/threonine-protein kinase At2g24130 [Vigna radiata var. radiata]